MLQYLPNLLLRSLKVDLSIFPPQKTWSDLFLLKLTDEEEHRWISNRYIMPPEKWRKGSLDLFYHSDFYLNTGHFMDDFKQMAHFVDEYEMCLNPLVSRGVAWSIYKGREGILDTELSYRLVDPPIALEFEPATTSVLKDLTLL